MLPTLEIKRLTESAKVPVRMSKEAAGLDIFTDEKLTLFPGVVVKAHTGFAMAIPKGYHAELHVRSSVGMQGIRLANCTGIIDSDYRGEVMFLLVNDTKDTLYIPKGYRVAQLILIKDPNFKIKEVANLKETERGNGGFGSTNDKEEK